MVNVLLNIKVIADGTKGSTWLAVLLIGVKGVVGGGGFLSHSVVLYFYFCVALTVYLWV